MESGYHGAKWFNLDRLFVDPKKVRPFAADLAARLARHGVDLVCGPMTGGAKLAELVAVELGIASVAAARFEPPGARGLFPVRYEIPLACREALRGKAVAIVDDAISAGSAVRGTHADLLRCGAKVVALGAFFVFGDVAESFAREQGLPLETLQWESYEIWQPSECPLCQRGVALETVSERA